MMKAKILSGGPILNKTQFIIYLIVICFSFHHNSTLKSQTTKNPAIILPTITNSSQPISGSWKLVNNSLFQKKETLTFKQVKNFPDYLTLPSCHHSDFSSAIKKDTFMKFLSKNRFIRIDVRKSTKAICLNSFEALDFKYNPKTKELFSFHEDSPNLINHGHLVRFQKNLIVRFKKSNPLNNPNINDLFSKKVEFYF